MLVPCSRHHFHCEAAVFNGRSKAAPPPLSDPRAAYFHCLAKSAVDQSPSSCRAGGDVAALSASSILALSVAKVKRNRFADRKGPFEHLSPQQLLQHVIKALISAVQRAVEPAIAQHGDDLPQALAATIHNGDWWRIQGPLLVRATGIFFTKIVTQLSCQRYFEHLAVTNLPAKLAGKLIKNQFRSASRKAARVGRLSASQAILLTTAMATALPYASFLVADWLHVLYEECADTQRDSMHSRLAKALKDNALMYTFGIVGTAAGTLVWPGIGSSGGAMVGEIVPSFLF